MDTRQLKNNRVVVYQCGVNGCCPSVEQEGDKIFIKDDYNNTVQMTKEQWYELVSAFSNK